MTTFYDNLMAHYAQRADNTLLSDSMKVPSHIEVAHALYVDTSNFLTDMLVHGSINLLVMPDAGSTYGFISTTLRKCVADNVVLGHTRYNDSDQDVDDMMSESNPVLIWKTVDDVIPTRLSKLAQRVWHCKISVAYLDELLLRLWPAEADDAPEFDADIVEGMTLSDVLVALRGATSAVDFVGRVQPPDDEPEAEPVTDLVDHPKPIDVSVRPLSEMTGFGEAKAWGVRLAKDIALYKAGKIAWSDMDSGLLLSSPPGGGKTTFARSLAAECEVELVVTGYAELMAADSGSGSGDSASRGLIKTFNKWRKRVQDGQVIIVFYDEADTMGVRGQNAHNDSWFTAQINAWLAFLDGAESRAGIVIIGATNHPDRVDPALRRPGRLDRHIEIPSPSHDDVVGMIAFHAGVQDNDPDFARMVRMLKGKTPADLMLIGRDARRRAREADRDPTAADVIASLPKSEFELDSAELHLATIHEAGHAVVGITLGIGVHSVDMHKLVTISIDPGSYIIRRYLAAATVRFGGLAAEQVLLGGFGGGGSVDLQMATTMVRQYLYEFGHGTMTHYSPKGPVTHAQEKRIEEVMQAMFAKAVAVVKANESKVRKLSAALKRDVYLDGDEIKKVIAFNRTTFFARKDADVDPTPHPWQEAA